MKNLLGILFVTFLIFSCNMSDSSEELSGEYTFVHEGENYNFIFGRNNIYADVIEYKFNDDYIVACQVPNRKMYLDYFSSELMGNYSTYFDYLKDSISEKFYRSRKEILADSVIPRIFKNRKISFENTSDDIIKSKEIADSIMENNPFHKKIFSLKKVYWIIKIKNNILIGPLSENEYKLKIKKLNLINELKLEK